MSNFKFEVGEVVILQSVQMPEWNGEYTVQSRPKAGEMYNCHISGRKVRNNSGGVGYVLDCEAIMKTNSGCDVAVIWAESALKKKQDPSGESFESMMEEINQMVRPLTPNK